jgi:hypothetical protein
MSFAYSCVFRIQETLCCFQHGSIGFFHKGEFTQHLQKRVDFEHVHISFNSNLLEKLFVPFILKYKASSNFADQRLTTLTINLFL